MCLPSYWENQWNSICFWGCTKWVTYPPETGLNIWRLFQDVISGKFLYCVCDTLIKKVAGACPTPYLKWQVRTPYDIKNQTTYSQLGDLTKPVRLANEEIDVAYSVIRVRRILAWWKSEESSGERVNSITPLKTAALSLTYLHPSYMNWATWPVAGAKGRTWGYDGSTGYRTGESGYDKKICWRSSWYWWQLQLYF